MVEAVDLDYKDDLPAAEEEAMLEFLREGSTGAAAAMEAGLRRLITRHLMKGSTMPRDAPLVAYIGLVRWLSQATPSKLPDGVLLRHAHHVWALADKEAREQTMQNNAAAVQRSGYAPSRTSDPAPLQGGQMARKPRRRAAPSRHITIA